MICTGSKWFSRLPERIRYSPR